MGHGWGVCLESVSSFQQMPKGVATSGSEIEDGVPESDQVVLASSSPPPTRERGGEDGATSSDLTIGCFDPVQGGSCHGNTGRLPVPLLAVRATSLSWKALHGTAFFRSGQIWWVGWPGGWDLPTSAETHSSYFWTEGRWRGLSALPLLAGGKEITHVSPDRSQQGDRELQIPPPPQAPGMTHPGLPLPSPVFSSWQSFLSQPQC